MHNNHYSPLLLLPNTFRAFYGAFPCLHPIQEQAIRPILKSRDLIIQSATGSGKTEAVLAPCLERIICSGLTESAIYIVPTRALAFDIRRRFESVLIERLGLRFAIRTGDIKRTGGGCPDIMLTTPESLDVMLGSSNSDLRGFLLRVNTVIIDEVHPFIHQYRGRQLVYVLQRLERRIGKQLQKIALSATIADPDVVIRFLGFSPDTVLITENVSRQILPRLIHLKNDEHELVTLLDDLYREWNYRKILIFANSRGRCDKIFGLLNRQGQFMGMAELHYSNLNVRERQIVEKRFRQRARSVCIATSTLELGIDVGDVDAVILFEPPDSVATFLQRIGRANRRQDTIHFWGICRGEQAGKQMLRFLALLRLASQGKVESPLSKYLPSVLSQQVISCLYEKKRLSLAALQDLFSCRAGTDEDSILNDIFQSLLKKNWLKKSGMNGLYTGGWQYRDALLEHRIWSNFPKNEEEYRLEVSGESVADIPESIVKQFDPGDRVLLAGRRLRILWIDEGKCKRVLTEPADRIDEKELYWLGMGCHVSYEVAQAMRDVLKSEKTAENEAAPGLFSRTRKLVRNELNKEKKAVVLDNGIEVILSANGTYQYRTFLGVIGNMILAWSIKDKFANYIENLCVVSDEIGLECSHWIQFEKLSLPLEPKDFTAWINRHFKVMRAMFPLNSFCATLPKELILRELNDFIYDERLIVFFKQYLSRSSEIVQGDPLNIKSGNIESRNLDFRNLDSMLRHPEKKVIAFLDTPSSAEPLLTWEKNRRTTGIPFSICEDARYRTRPLTGTIIGEYFRHQLCSRWLSFHFLLPEHQPFRRTQVDDELTTLRMARGREFEREILTDLRKQNEILTIISEKDETGKMRSLKDRFNETCAQLQRLAQQNSLAGNLYLAQGVLIIDAVLSPSPAFFNGQAGKKISIDGVGIPDLIQVSQGKEKTLLQVGDIKSSSVPRYYQKWQVAFYAFLLKTLIHTDMARFQSLAPSRNQSFACEVKVADTGFLLIRSPLNDAPQRHTFDLRPYMTTFKAIFRNLNTCLSGSPSSTFWQLQKHCTNCPYLEFCYQQAMTQEDVQFIPHLTFGTLQKIRTLGMKSLEETSAWFASSSQKNSIDTGKPPVSSQSLSPACGANASSGNRPPFAPLQRERLQGALNALLHNKIAIVKKKTSLFPANISTSFFVHLLHDPVSMQPCGIGLCMQKRGEDLKTLTWTTFTSQVSDKLRDGTSADTDRRQIWQDFSNCFQELWQAAIDNGRGPHIFLFGMAVRQGIKDWAALMEDMHVCGLLRHGLNPHWTDLRQALQKHFLLPLPGNMTLFALNRILGLADESEIPVPDTLFQGDRLPDAEMNGKNSKEIIQAYLATILKLKAKLQKWILSHLESEWNQEEWRIIPEGGSTRAEAYQHFIEVEKACQETDIKALQELSLEERVERFRALGPLDFTGTVLDDEGRFLYMFTIADESGLSKFRRGDFLKLVPAGVDDLQSGMSVIMAQYSPQIGEVALHSRQYGNMRLHKGISYSLEEDGDDWNTPKLLQVVQTVYSTRVSHPLTDLFAGKWDFEQPSDWQEWVRGWLQSEGAVARLNQSQQHALQLPFQYALSLIQGPPGTGKTNLLGWILIALIRHAQTTGSKLRIAVSGSTHQAIDQVLSKVVNLVNTHNLQDFPARCVKLGRWEGPEFEEENKNMQVEPLTDAGQALLSPYLILGSTGYGLYNMFQNHNNSVTSPKPFDWVIFDEASQMLAPQAMLSLIYGKGNFIFLGDIHQLPPVIRSATFKEESWSETLHDDLIETEVRRSLLNILLRRYPHHSKQLDITYRMNAEICMFPSQTWYNSTLRPAPENARTRLSLNGPAKNDLLDKIINPQKPVVLVLTDHQGCHQESAIEAEIMAQLACRLLIDRGVDKEQLALISPHRAQNNAIARRLSELSGMSAEDLPLIDTVERIQGAERDVILFGFTCSDPDHVLSEFLNNPNRFNVAMTRARKKLIVAGSKTFFSAIAHTEKQLQANACFKAFFEHCRENDCCFELASVRFPVSDN
jgi:superfamily II DNA/RNA helicase